MLIPIYLQELCIIKDGINYQQLKKWEYQTLLFLKQPQKKILHIQLIE